MFRPFFILSIIFNALFAAATPKPIPPIISKLLKKEGEVRLTYIGVEQWVDIPDLPVNFKNEGQHLLKTEDGLYVTIPGTGRLYKAEIIGEKIDFKRIDSTFFAGSNFHSLSFNIGNSIYNFAGEGFWHTNGILREFDFKSKEWYAIKLNKEIHRNFNLKIPGTFLYYIDNSNQNLYTQGSYSSANYIKEPFSDTAYKDKVYKLNLTKGDWVELGKANYKNITTLSLNSFGILSYEQLIDLENNKIYNHDLELQINSIIGNSIKDNYLTISFCIDSTIYFGNSRNRFDSLTISRSNLIDTKQPAFISIESDSQTFMSKIGIISIIVLAGTLFFILFAKFRKKPTFSAKSIDTPTLTQNQLNKDDESLNNPVIYRSGKLVQLLTDQEKDFITYIYQNSKDDRLTTIEETNKILGTSSKTIEIQKRVRGEMINGINQKLSIIAKVKRPIIEKQRSEFDKRSFEYYIHSDHFNIVDDIIEINKKI